MQHTQRTQLYIPDDLRTLIDRQRAISGESMAAYIRRATRAHAEKEKKGKTDLKKLADEVLGVPTIGHNLAEKWIKEIRRDRRLEDERLEKKWVSARKKG